MPHAYSEDSLSNRDGALRRTWLTSGAGVGGNLRRTLTRLSATFSHPMDEGASLGRQTKGVRLCAALERLSACPTGSPALPPRGRHCRRGLTRDRSAMSLEAANREVYLLLKEGIKVSVPDQSRHLTPIQWLPKPATSQLPQVR